jgi:hypothetical protein
MIVLPTDSATRLLPGSMNGDDVVVVESNKENKHTMAGDDDNLPHARVCLRL